jgi:hypothetical protein
LEDFIFKISNFKAQCLDYQQFAESNLQFYSFSILLAIKKAVSTKVETATLLLPLNLNNYSVKLVSLSRRFVFTSYNYLGLVRLIPI